MTQRSRNSIPKAVRLAVWNRDIGATNAEGKCFVCKRTIHMMEFEVGHNRARAKGGSDDIGNLRPICGTCNKSMGTMSIDDFKKKYFDGSRTSAGKRKKTLSPRRKRVAQMSSVEYLRHLGKAPIDLTDAEFKIWDKK